MTQAPEHRCGNCSEAVASSDVTCPHCGVLLAAYQSPSGAASGDVYATKPVDATPPPSPPTTTATAPPASATPPASASDAGNRPTSRPTSLTSPTSPIGSDSIADELREMAKDESGFAAQVEAELKEAKVVIDEGGGSRIETAPTVPDVVVAPTGEAGKASAAAATPQSKPQPVRVIRASEQAEAKPDPNRKLNPPKPRAQTMLNADWVPSSTAPEPRDRSGEASTKGKKNTLFPFVIVFFVAAMFVFRNPAAVIFLVVALGLGAFFIKFLISASKSTSRSTTQMPYDKPNRRRKR
jgi:hypothetical protein